VAQREINGATGLSSMAAAARFHIKHWHALLLMMMIMLLLHIAHEGKSGRTKKYSRVFVVSLKADCLYYCSQALLHYQPCVIPEWSQKENGGSCNALTPQCSLERSFQPLTPSQ